MNPKQKNALTQLAAWGQDMGWYEDSFMPIGSSIDILNCKLVLTCFACPEQYDVFFNEEPIGYLRLRHGSFSACYPDVGGEFVFEAEPEGDGCFMEHERLPYLHLAVEALEAKHRKVLADREQPPSSQE